MIFRIITVNEDSGKGTPTFYETPKYLYEMGMCLCDKCGKVHSIDYAFCNDCFMEILIVVIRAEKPDDAKIIESVKKLKNKKS